MRKFSLTLILILTLTVTILGINLREEAKKHKKNAEKYFTEGHFELAIEEYKKVLSFAPEMDDEIKENFKTAQLNYGISIIDSRKKEAMKIFAELAFLRPDYSTPHYYLGYISEKEKDYENAKKHYQKFLELEKTDVEKKLDVKDKIAAWQVDMDAYKSGIEFMSNGEFALAVEEFSRVKTINRKNADYYIQKATVILTGSEPVDPPKDTVRAKADNTSGSDAKVGLTERSAIIESFKTAIANEDSGLLASIISPNYISSVGDKNSFIGYWEDFWFLFFQSITLTYSNVQESMISGSDYIISFDYQIIAIYSGKDMSLYKEEFAFGNEITRSGTMIFSVKNENGKWAIVQ